MMRHLIGAGALAVFALAGVASAQSEDSAGPVVVELFTSQGCSSCPPADALLAELAGREDVLALSLHVDYWDYIGWADVFARPAFTLRQKGYAKAAGQRMIYTPQMIVGGDTDVVGHKTMKVVDAIRKHLDRPATVAIEVGRDGDRYTVLLVPRQPGLGPAVVQLVRYAPHKTVEITHGENAGRTLRYTNVVDHIRQVAEWSGAAPQKLELDIEGGDHAAVIVQKAPYGEVLAAARLR